MKKYIYTKESESVIVETDGLGRIDNFMVTGVIGKNYSNLVQSGFCFKMGDEVSIASMLNMAKLCKAKVECFEGNALVQDESVDYTEEPVVEPVVSVYGVEIERPETVVAGETYDVKTTLKTLTKGDKGYDKVIVRFATVAPEGGECTMTLVDSLGSQFKFVNNGTWGPSEGFPLPAEYEATTPMQVSYNQAGTYVHTTELVNLEDNSVIISDTAEVTVAEKSED